MTFTPNRPGGASAPGRPWDQQRDPFVATQVRPIGQPVDYRPTAPDRFGGYVQRPQPIAPPAPVPRYQAAPMPYQAPPPPAGPNRRWGPIAAGATIVAAVAAVGVVAVLIAAGSMSRRTSESTGAGGVQQTVAAPASTVNPPPAATIAVGALPGLLLNQATINRMVGATDMGVEPGDPALPYAAGPIDHPECSGIWHPAERPTLQGSGWVALQANSFREHAGGWKHLATQAVVAFPSAEAASAFATSQAATWAKCSGKLLTETPKDSPPNLWSVGPVTNREAMLTVRFMQEGTGGWGCQRAQTVRNNVVIDVRTCGFFPTDQAGTVAGAIADRVSTQQ